MVVSCGGCEDTRTFIYIYNIYIYCIYLSEVFQLNFQRYTKWHLDGSVSENLDFNRKIAQNKSLGQQAQISMKKHSKCQDLQRFSQIS